MKAKLEKIAAPQGRLFTAFESWSQSFRGPYHFHPEVELVAILGGHGRRIVGDHIASFGPGDLVLMGPDLPHQYSSDSFPKNLPDRAGTIVLQFLPGILGDPLWSAPEGATLRTLLQKARGGVFFDGPEARKAIGQMREVVAAEGLARFIALLRVFETLDGIANPHGLASVGYAPLLDARYSSRVSKACDFIQQRFQEPISQAATAEHVTMSPSAFSRMFLRATGLTFTAFLTGVRLSEASRELIETDSTIAEIAFRCGFANLSNFNRRFLEARQMTPRQYRRRGS